MRWLCSVVVFLAPQAVGFAAEPLCEKLKHQGDLYSVCRVDLREVRLEVFNLDGDGQPLRNFSALAKLTEDDGKELRFAMNAGMFDENLKPIGLYVEEGVQKKKLNRRDGSGNFHLKPNGVFYVKGDRLGVVATEAYAKKNLEPDFATQSGPMLVIEGEIHPKFSETGTSLKRRNGVGMVDDHTAVFAISENAVNFHDFAIFFRDGLNCANALFLDGSVSSLYSPELGRNDQFLPLGPMVGAVELR
jgi:prepilin-type processing-associated H-X9-DG protein